MNPRSSKKRERNSSRVSRSGFERGSVEAKDLEALHPPPDASDLDRASASAQTTEIRSTSSTEGHIDHLVRESIRNGHAARDRIPHGLPGAWQAHYGLDHGHLRARARLHPGYVADIVLLEGRTRPARIHSVLKAGQWTQELPSFASRPTPREFANTIKAARPPEARDLEGPSGRVHVIDVLPGKIITGRSVADHKGAGSSATLRCLERYGRGSKPAQRLRPRLRNRTSRGAIASSVGHDSHNLITVGSEPGEVTCA